MNKSESIQELAKALAKFQGEISNPTNTATNPFFKSKYAPLAEVINVTRPILFKHGLSIVQAPSTDGDNINITTLLMHESGEWIEAPALSLKMDKVTAQGAGSAITYARRYAISAILGISSEDDDDGNGAEPITHVKPTQTKDNKGNQISKPDLDKEAISDASYASEKQLKFMFKLFKDKNYSEDSIKSYLKNAYNKDSSKSLTKKEAGEIIEMLNGLGE